MRVPFIGLDSEYAEVTEPCMARIRDVFDSRTFVLGSQTAELEASMVKLTGSRHATACSSGSDALYLALRALGVGSGDAVLVPTFSFFATAGSVDRVGAAPVFVDIDEETFNAGSEHFVAAIEREFENKGGRRIHRRHGAELKALIVVHLYGRAVAMAGITDLAEKLGITIIEDAAQAIGALSDTGRVGSVGDAACFSYYPTKNLGGAGDGGAVTTSDDGVAEAVRRLRAHGAEAGSYEHQECGINARMGELQAAVLNAKMPHLQAWTDARVSAAEKYRDRLEVLQGDRMRLAAPASEGSHVYHQFVVRIAPAERAAVRERLAEGGVETRVFYPLPLHLQPCFEHLRYREQDLPAAEAAANEVLALPLHPSLSSPQIDHVCECLAEALAA